jgi:formylglycine-generating enzyme required for sulfatase activity
MSRRKRKKTKLPSVETPSQTMEPVPAAPAGAPLTRRAWITGTALVIACAVVGYFAANYFTKPATAERKAPTAVEGDGVTGPKGMVWVPAGEFLMGSDHKLAQPNERPTHRVKVGGFWMDQHHVTNAEFRRFVQATGYVTTAERKPDWETLKVQVPPGTPRPPDSALVPGAMVFAAADRPVRLDDWSQWWRFVRGASWKRPQGPGSSIDGRDDHPVVQVSYEDVLAYAKWTGKRLPTEAEWEFAARGGLEQATYVWGEEFAPSGQRMANTFEGQFPVVNPKAGGAVGTTAVRTFPANGYGLYDMTGNAWQWVGDRYRADYFQQLAGRGLIENPQGPPDSYDPDDRSAPPNAPRRVTRGGSFLCAVNYCLSYRPSARRGNDPYNPMSHIGFRLVMTPEVWDQSKTKRAAR